jgi:alcohol dehydrogenase
MINPFEFLLPTKIRYGAGSIQVLGEELKALNAKNIMVITDKGLSKSEVMEKLTAILKREAFCFITYDEIEANPKDYNVEACAETARAENIDTLVAFGGGSPIDAAKAVAVLARQGGRVRDYQGKGKIKDDCLPLLTIPTTAGTGSEVTFSSVITDTKEIPHQKHVDRRKNRHH